MNIRYLTQEEKQTVKALYRTCFSEDSDAFVEYYHSEKCKDNEIIVALDGQKVTCMVHGNPFIVSLCHTRHRIHYIVAVATDPAYRRQGLMRQVLGTILIDQAKRGEPFSFLMPADPAYYRSMGYRYWDNQRVFTLSKEEEQAMQNRICPLHMEDAKQAADWTNEYLDEQMDLFVVRDEAYYHRLVKEQESEGGSVSFSADGIFCYSTEMGFEIREPILPSQIAEQVKPVMMGRILNLKTFIESLKSDTDWAVDVEITDEIIPENNGCFHIEIGQNGGNLTPLMPDEKEHAVPIEIGKLGSLLFHQLKIFINELV